MKIFLSALGCKLNEGELESWTRKFVADGNEIVHDVREADLCVVNTCTVTHVAAKKSRGLVKRVAHSNKEAKIILTGCYATLSPEEARTLPNVLTVVPNSDKDSLVALAGKLRCDSELQMSENGCRMPAALSGELGSEAYQTATSIALGRDTALPALGAGGKGISPHARTRAFVKIEDGCNMSCTYCIIPRARGKALSRPQDEIVLEIGTLVESGFQEVILTGVQISDYRLEEREAGRGRLRGLCSLVRDILHKTELPRLRLTSIAPWDLDEELLDLFTDDRLCRHLHLSLQSGSSTVLRRMRRPYTAEQFEEGVRLARSRLPDVGITTDVIVGFPGESDVEFEESLGFVERMEFARVHVFPYSSRDGTLAARLPLQVNNMVKEQRAKAMQHVAAASAVRYASRFVGRTLPVLYETEADPPGTWSGYTDNYVRVLTRGAERLGNRIMPTRIERIDHDGALGSLDLL